VQNLIGSIAIAVTLGAVSLAAPPARVESLRWMTGCWEQKGARATVEEHWTRPAGGAMIGIGRTIRHALTGDTTTSYEFTRIIERSGKLVFVAQPSGQTPADFTEESLSDSSVTFSNPAHDYPQSVSYARRGSDSLYARTDGNIGGKNRRIEFAYARRSCERTD
jgi:uncharacterized protein DUF6265